MGFLRLYLALCVVRFHAYQFPLKQALGAAGGQGGIFPFDPLLLLNGRQAVQLFYVLSGFYISMILCEKYQAPGGVRVFYLKRVLRLLPLYALVTLAVVAVALGTDEVRSFQARMEPGGFLALAGADMASMLLVGLSNLLIVGADVLWFLRLTPEGAQWAPFQLSPLHNGSAFSLNPPAFTLAIEMYFYALAPLLVRSVRRVALLLLAGFLYLLGLRLAGEWNVISSYHFFPASWLYFAMGALAYHAMRGHVSRKALAMGALPYVALFFLCFTPTGEPREDIGFVVMWVLVSLAVYWVPWLFVRTKRWRVDGFLGDMSYTVYVVHFPLLLYTDGTALQALLWVWLLALCLAVTLVFERPLERWRQGIG